MVQTVGMAVVAALIGAGGFGALVFQGLLSSAIDLVLLGVIPVIALAVVIDALFDLWIAFLKEQPMIEFNHVSKTFGDQQAVSDLNLHFSEGSFSVLIGTSGSGKSTTLKMINRLVEHDSGTIRFAGKRSAACRCLNCAVAWAMPFSLSVFFPTGRWRKISPPYRNYKVVACAD